MEENNLNYAAKKPSEQKQEKRRKFRKRAIILGLAGLLTAGVVGLTNQRITSFFSGQQEVSERSKYIPMWDIVFGKMGFESELIYGDRANYLLFCYNPQIFGEHGFYIKSGTYKVHRENSIMGVEVISENTFIW